MTKQEIINKLKVNKVATKMNEEEYWKLIDQSLQQTQSLEEQELFLKKELKRLSLIQLVEFHNTTVTLYFKTYENNDIFDYIDYADNICSRDVLEFTPIFGFLISRGQKTFEELFNNPASTENVLKDYEDFGMFIQLPKKIFTMKTGQDIDNYSDTDTLLQKVEAPFWLYK